MCKMKTVVVLACLSLVSVSLSSAADSFAECFNKNQSVQRYICFNDSQGHWATPLWIRYNDLPPPMLSLPSSGCIKDTGGFFNKPGEILKECLQQEKGDRIQYWP